MSELINNSRERIDVIKRLLLDLHAGRSVDETRAELKKIMASVPYNDVVVAEEEIIREGLPAEEVLKFCDLHTEALKEHLTHESTLTIPAGHPVATFIEENLEIRKLISKIKKIQSATAAVEDRTLGASDALLQIRTLFNELTDINKHYMRKENLLFPFLERYEITGPPTVMWGKHDEIRSFLKSSLELLNISDDAITYDELESFFELMFNQTLRAVEEMIYKEEKILFPMCLDTLNESDWYQVYSQSDEIGYCLTAPSAEWKVSAGIKNEVQNSSGKIKLSTGSFSLEELEGIFGSLPVDITFVDKDDKVAFFSHGEDRIFQRNKAVLGRQVQYCHPPSSVDTVNKILDDFKSGKQNSAKFWINIKGMMVHIAYYAVRNSEGKYLGTLEVTQDIKQFKMLEGERRLLTYEEGRN